MYKTKMSNAPHKFFLPYLIILICGTEASKEPSLFEIPFSFFVEAFYSHASNCIIKVVSIVQAYVKSDFVYKFFKTDKIIPQI